MTKLEIQTSEVFEPLLGPSRYKGIYGGRGSGKSHFFGGLAVERGLTKSDARILCVREVQNSIEESSKKLIESKIEAFGVGYAFDVQKSVINTRGGGIYLFKGMQDHTAQRVKSLEGFDVVWVEEAQDLSERSIEILRPTIREAGSELWFSWNPRRSTDAIDQLLRGIAPPDNAIIIRANYSDNPWFPEELEAERLHDYDNNRMRYGHIWLGEYEPQAIGAIWDRLTIQNSRVAPLEVEETEKLMARIVVAVDPAISSEPQADEHGIVVAGIGKDGRGYVLEDATCRGDPAKWSRMVVAMFDKWGADQIVAEVN